MPKHRVSEGKPNLPRAWWLECLAKLQSAACGVTVEGLTCVALVPVKFDAIETDRS